MIKVKSIIKVLQDKGITKWLISENNTQSYKN